jgi:hypothetical protein
MQWPRSGWTQAVIAFMVGLASAICAFKITADHQIALYAREYPHDGQDGLGAVMDGFGAGAFMLLIVFAVLFVVQRIAVKR